MDGVARPMPDRTERWSNGPGASYAPHTHAYRKVLVVEQGSITFEISGRPRSVALGERIEIPAGTVHSALVGPDGVVCTETHYPPPRPNRDTPQRNAQARN